MTKQEILSVLDTCVTTQYPNGWAVQDFDDTPLYNAGFEVTNSRPSGFEDWSRAYIGNGYWVFVDWHNSQTGGLQYYYHVEAFPKN